MKKIKKIKESRVLDIINKLINEQTGGEIVVEAIGSFGDAPKFDGLRTLMRDLKSRVERALRGTTPYIIKPQSNGMIAKAKRTTGNELSLSVTLAPAKEEDRHWYFDGAIAIYSTITQDNTDYIKSTLLSKVGEKMKGFSGSEKTAINLGRNHLGLDSFGALDPANPDKRFKMFIHYAAAKRPFGYDDVTGDNEPEVKVDNPAAPIVNTPTNNTTPAAEEPENISGDFTSDNGDDAHNFKELEKKLEVTLKEFYDKGKNPKIVSIKANITQSGGSFTTKYEAKIEESNDGKAWMGFTSRGSMGPNYAERADDQYYGGRYDEQGNPVMTTDPETGKKVQLNIGQGKKKKDGTPNPCYGISLAQCLKTQLKAGDVELIATIEDKRVPFKQYFVQFTKPKEYPAH